MHLIPFTKTFRYLYSGSLVGQAFFPALGADKPKQWCSACFFGTKSARNNRKRGLCKAKSRVLDRIKKCCSRRSMGILPMISAPHGCNGQDARSTFAATVLLDLLQTAFRRNLDFINKLRQAGCLRHYVPKSFCKWY